MSIARWPVHLAPGITDRRSVIIPGLSSSTIAARGAPMESERENIGLFDAIYSQRQFIRYKPDPVPREAIDRIIDAAIRAPNGGNRQPWEFIVVTDRDLVRAIGEVYRDVWLGTFGATAPPDESPVYRAARVLAHHMPDVPAMILVCADHRRGSPPPKAGEPLVRNRYASSIWLAVQNLFLAARALGP